MPAPTRATGRPACTVALALAWLAAPAAAEPRGPRPTRPTVWETIDPATVPVEVNSHIIYLNRCAGTGCTVVQGPTNATADPVRSSLGHGVLSPFARSEDVWTTVVGCVREVFSPFNVEITEV